MQPLSNGRVVTYLSLSPARPEALRHPDPTNPESRVNDSQAV